MTTQIEAMKNALDALGTCEDMLPNYHQWLSDAKHELRAAIEAAEKVGPDGYVEIEIYDGIQDFGFAASFEQDVLDHIKDKVLRLIDEEITVPEMHVKPFYLHPPSAEIEELRKDAERYHFILPIVTGIDSDNADKIAMAIATQLMKGLDGDAAIDAAMQEKQP